MSGDDFINLHELEALARERLPADVFDYYAGGAHDEITVRENRAAYDRIALRPRILVDVSARDLSTTVLGSQLTAPIGIAPMAFQGMAHPDAELGTARGAAASRTLMTLSTFASSTLEAVRSSTSAPLWFQLYVFKDRGATRALVSRAEGAGYSALVVTADAPMLGRRERDVRRRFQIPAGVPHAVAPPAPSPEAPMDSPLAHHFAHQMDPSLTWRDLEWLATLTRLPVLVKGVLRGDDACRAADHGAAGVVVSNHGGRQLDTAVATADALPEVARSVGDRLTVLVDGGIRRGTDVLKAVALGARAVLVGRPVLWGLAVGGEAGVARVLELLRAELDLAMALCGCRSLAEITPELLWSADRARPGQ
ncbi:MAG: alpha-hydroxy-acid oxidizing protein [Gemmatimonadota bacterium]|nr:alpha-hydroxy-acid oxidizing protein [Gemmatimonadota bacterium]